MPGTRPGMTAFLFETPFHLRAIALRTLPIDTILLKFDFSSAPPFNASRVSQAENTQGAEMADFWIVGGLMAGAFVLPLYFLVMRWLTGPQRVIFFFLIGALLLTISAQIYNNSIAGHDLPLGDILAKLPFLALTLGWFVCGLFHALVSLSRASASGFQHRNSRRLQTNSASIELF
jgi:uncharacterized membrane protein YciS (DUF1049 family)